MSACTNGLVFMAGYNMEASVNWEKINFACLFAFVPGFEHKISLAARKKRRGGVLCC